MNRQCWHLWCRYWRAFTFYQSAQTQQPADLRSVSTSVPKASAETRSAKQAHPPPQITETALSQMPHRSFPEKEWLVPCFSDTRRKWWTGVNRNALQAGTPSSLFALCIPLSMQECLSPHSPLCLYSS